MNSHKLVLAACMWALSLSTLAQTNLREGYVITLQSDTIHGSIDYRGDNRNSTKCVFIANGSQQYQTFLPGDIYGYRFLDNGRFYVTKDVPLGGKTEKVFLEYVMRAQTNLYFYGNNTTGNYCYIESEDGQLVPVMLESYTSNIEDAAVRRKRLTPAYQVLSRSTTASKMLWTKELNLKNIVSVVKTYNDDVCPDGVCELFEYKSPKTPKEDRVAHLVVAAGADCMTLQFRKVLNKYDQIIAHDFDYYCPYIEVGADCYIDRYVRGLYFLGRVNYRYANTVFEMPNGQNKDFEANIFGAKAGVGYQYKGWKIQPRVFAGFSYSQILIDKNDTDIRDCSGIMFGKWGDAYYAPMGGIGIICPLRKGALLMDVTYETCTSGLSDVKMTDYSLKLGYQF